MNCRREGIAGVHIAIAAALIGGCVSGAWGEVITIVLPSRPSPTESHAAEELGTYLQAITGRRVRLWPDLPAWGELSDWQKEGGPFFVVGDTRFAADLVRQCTQMGPEAYCLRADGNALFLVGATDRGTLYAVYEYLSSLGCRWLVPGREGEVLPRLSALPPFTQDEFHCAANRRRDLADFNDIEPYLFDWLVRNRINSAAAHSRLDAAWGPLLEDAWERRGGCVRVKYYDHSYAALVPEALFADHPDWFALIGGRRRTRAFDGYWNTDFPTQFCTSHPQAVQYVIETVKAFFDAHPQYESFGLIPVDGGQWCECADCQALDRPPGGHAGRVIALANAVAEATDASHPEKEILVLAYSDYLQPPEGIGIHPRVRVQVCLWPSHFQPIAGPQTQEGQCYWEQFRKWAARRCRLGTWLYQLYSAQTPFDLSVRAMAVDARTYRRLGADHVLHECGGSQTWKRNPMATWCWMQLAWDPARNWRGLIRDFCLNYYGAAGEDVAAMFLRIEERIARTGALLKADIYTAPFVAELRHRLSMALRHADSPQSRERVQALVDMLPDPSAFPIPLPARWYHVAATWHASEGKGTVALYVDGKRRAMAHGNWQAWRPEETLYIGRRRHRGSSFTGQMDELRMSSVPRSAFDLSHPASLDDQTTLLSHFDRDGNLDPDFSRGDPKMVTRLPYPYTPATATSEGRFGAGLDFGDCASCARFDTVVYSSDHVLNPDAGTVELWIRPDARTRYVANGVLLDAGALVFYLSNNVLCIEVGGLTAKHDLSKVSAGLPKK